MHKHGTDQRFTTVKISKRLAKALKTLAMEDGRKLYALLDEAVELYLQGRERHEAIIKVNRAVSV